MDLGAYMQIEDLDKILEENNIVIPRLRGLRLMKNEEVVTQEEINEIAKNNGLYECDGLCRRNFVLNAGWATFSAYTDWIAEKYLEYKIGENGNVYHTQPLAVKWDKIHGKKRKAFKYVLKKNRKRAEEQFRMWNKYCGKDDVLYIHCRLGAGNWSNYDCDEIIKNQPWFLDCVEDSFDCTYLDVYAKIKK